MRCAGFRRKLRLKQSRYKEWVRFQFYNPGISVGIFAHNAELVFKHIGTKRFIKSEVACELLSGKTFAISVKYKRIR